MRKIFALLMLLCTICASAAEITGTYNGRLSISVDNAAPTVKENQNVIVTDGNVVKLTIPNFTYSGYPEADVVITASKDVDGNLSLQTIKYGFLRLSAKLNSGSKVDGQSCNISLSISAVIQKIEVTFSGTK